MPNGCQTVAEVLFVDARIDCPDHAVAHLYSSLGREGQGGSQTIMNESDLAENFAQCTSGQARDRAYNAEGPADSDIFFDYDNLIDLEGLFDHVRNSENLLIILSGETLFRLLKS